MRLKALSLLSLGTFLERDGSQVAYLEWKTAQRVPECCQTPYLCGRPARAALHLHLCPGGVLLTLEVV